MNDSLGKGITKLTQEKLETEYIHRRILKGSHISTFQKEQNITILFTMPRKQMGKLPSS